LSLPRPAWSAVNPGNRAAAAELVGAVLAASEPQLRGGGDLLDCGCGTGRLLGALAAVGVAPERLFGVDVDPARVAAAGRRVPGATAIVGDARALPFEGQAFDAVFLIVSLSSMGSAESVHAALAEGRRVLAPGGALIVYEPRLPNPFNRSTRLFRRADLEAVGLAPVESRSLTLLPPLGRRLGRLTPALHPLLSALPPLRSHRLLVHRSAAGRSDPGGSAQWGDAVIRRRDPEGGGGEIAAS
jgi:SAM-dependent methyltransferase